MNRYKLLFVIFFVCAMSGSNVSAQTLEMWIMPNGANPKGTIEELLQEFTNTTGIKVNVTVLDWGVAWSRISRALESGEGTPHLLQLGTTWVGHFAYKNTLSPLNDHIRGMDPGRFHEASMNTVSLHGSGVMYAVPWFVDVRVLLANRKHLDSAGIDPAGIKTYSDFVEALRAIKDAQFRLADGTPVYPFSFPGKSDWNIPHNFAPWIWGEGGNFIVNENGKWRSNLLHENTIKGILRYLNFVSNNLINTETLKENTANVTQRFNRGELGFIVSTTDVINQIGVTLSEGGLLESPIGQDGIYVFAYPAGKMGSVSFVGGSNLAIPKNHQNNPNAVRLLKYLTSPSLLEAYSSRLGFIPPDTTLWHKWEKNPAYAPVIKAVRSGRTYPQIPQWGDVEAALVNCFSDVWTLVDGYYSDSLLYEILVNYNSRLNEILNYEQIDTAMSYSDFLAVVERSRALELEANQKQAEMKGFNRDHIVLIVFGVVLVLVLVAFNPVKKALSNKNSEGDNS